MPGVAQHLPQEGALQNADAWFDREKRTDQPPLADPGMDDADRDRENGGGDKGDAAHDHLHTGAYGYARASLARVNTAAYGMRMKDSLDRSAWVSAGLAALADKGLDSVRVERLAADLKVTKGSFTGTSAIAPTCSP